MRFLITDEKKNILPDVTVSEAGQTEDGAALLAIHAMNAHETVHFEWAEPMLDHVSVWHPTCGRGRNLPQWFHAQRTDACFYRGAPVLATVRAYGNIHRTIALEDGVIGSSLGYYVDDFSENDTVVFTADLRNVPAGYRALLRIDKTPKPLNDALGNVWRWWTERAERAVPVPEDAFAPLYSTWYSYHQTPSQAALTEELKLAADMGFRTVILDDGWQIEGAGTKDYLKSGDWVPAADKFPDFAGFVKDVHGFGQKLILWFAVPFAGFRTQAFRRFRDKLLREEKGYINAGILDVRYREVRDAIIGTYVRFIREYDIDGLKLDFIDSFNESPDTPPFNDKMDARTVTDAVKLLLDGICAAALALKPDFLFEYRQFYVGPEIMRYGNLLRVCDCAFDAVTNRIGIADLRMMTRDIAVHSDMLLWSPEESARNCALQLINILFGVPQISVRLAEIGEEQHKLLKAHIKYREENRNVLLHGSFGVQHPELGYTALWAEKDGKKIAALYGETAWRPEAENEDIFNAAGGESMVLVNEKGSPLQITVFNCFGEETHAFTSSAPAIPVDVPVGGRVNVRRQAQEAQT